MISPITSLVNRNQPLQVVEDDPIRRFQDDLPQFHLWVEERRIAPHMRELMTADPRSAVVNAGVLLEEHVKELLEITTVKIQGYRKFHKTSNTEAVSWAYRLGIIDMAMVKELMMMDRIRDWFVLGWSQNMEFERPEVSVMVDCLRSPRLFFPLDEGDAQRPWSMKVFNWTMKRNRRDWWELSTAALLGELVELLRDAKRPPPTEVPWA
ncbi:MAG: hypothetical protein O2821_02285 [Chloroflexi bacterium]|nr:hypothetical protein [Chloroflexota bacterium]MDA1226552.1 hypothetical protein [Chloroflexota bacterium]